MAAERARGRRVVNRFGPIMGDDVRAGARATLGRRFETVPQPWRPGGREADG